MNDWSRRSVLATSGAAIAGLAGCTSSGSGAGGDGGTASPESGPTLDTYDVAGSSGETVPVEPEGRVALLDFFATWCAPCKPQMAELREVREAFPDIHMLSITWEREEAAIRDFWREYEGTWNVASDPQLRTGEEYGVDRLPTMVIVDAEGTEVWRHVGLSKADTIGEQVEAAKR